MGHTHFTIFLSISLDLSALGVVSASRGSTQLLSRIVVPSPPQPEIFSYGHYQVLLWLYGDVD